MFKINAFLFLISLCIISCKQEVKQKSFLDLKKPAKTKLKLIFKEENRNLMDFSENEINSLHEFYQNRNFKPLWISDSSYTKNGKIMIHLFENKLALSIPENRGYPKVRKNKNLIINELNLTYSLIALSNDLRNGFFDTLTKKQKSFDISNFSSKQNTSFYSKNQSLKKVIHKIISWGPRDTVYQKLAKLHFEFTYKRQFKDKDLHVPIFKKDSLKSLNLAKLSLIEKGYLKENDSDSVFLNALVTFQNENGIKPDGVIGQTTADALNETMLEKCQRSAVVLEKLRWKKRSGKRYIEINIPEYKLRFYADDSLKSVNRIVVGKYSTQTPEFQSELRSIIAYPNWTVPYSITSKEMLPDVKKDVFYFSKNNMKIYKKDEEIDPMSVDWRKIKVKTFPYKVVQQPGTHNSLGIIKFEFTNKYGVYIHDTPSKSLFNSVLRSYSHGCIRCEKPLDLAKIILEKDQNIVISDSLDSIMTRVIHRPIPLKKRIPIYIEYYSVVVNETNQLTFLRDIYRRDEKWRKWMFN